MAARPRLSEACSEVYGVADGHEVLRLGSGGKRGGCQRIRNRQLSRLAQSGYHAAGDHGSALARPRRAEAAVEATWPTKKISGPELPHAALLYSVG
ncbi:hypothetical protein ACP70R_028124 [Stipagrostis hirtigluma subsp. patula]